MDEKEVKRLIDQEFKKREARQRFGRQNVNLHNHDGGESPRIRDIDLDRNPAVLGRVIFSNTGDYTFRLNLPQTPRLCTLNANLFDNIDAPTVRYSIFGQAYLGNAIYLQPENDRNVTTGGIPYPAPTNLQDGTEATIPAQSSTFFGFVNGANAATAGDSQFHIVNVFGSATMRMTVVDFSKDKIVFRVTSLSSGYDLAANFLII